MEQPNGKEIKKCPFMSGIVVVPIQEKGKALIEQPNKAPQLSPMAITGSCIEDQCVMYDKEDGLCLVREGLAAMVDLEASKDAKPTN